MTPEALYGTAGIILSGLMTYIPGLRVKYASLDPTAKRLAMVGCLLLAAIGMAGWTCKSPQEGLTFGMCLSGFDWSTVATSFFLALVGNQSADRILPKPQDVKDAAEESHQKAEDASEAARR